MPCLGKQQQGRQNSQESAVDCENTQGETMVGRESSRKDPFRYIDDGFDVLRMMMCDRERNASVHLAKW